MPPKESFTSLAPTKDSSKKILLPQQVGFNYSRPWNPLKNFQFGPYRMKAWKDFFHLALLVSINAHQGEVEQPYHSRTVTNPERRTVQCSSQKGWRVREVRYVRRETSSQLCGA